MPPPPQSCPAGHVPHCRRLPQPSPAGPQVMFCWAHVSPMQPPPHWPGMPPPPHVCGGVHGPQSIEPPQPSPAGPQPTFCWAQVCFWQTPPSRGIGTHCPNTPLPPHCWPAGHGPQSMAPPQPLPAGPHEMFCAAQVTGVHVGDGGGGTQDARSQIMNSRIFSCGVKSVVHSPGNVWPLVAKPFPPMPATWKSLKMACPHWLATPTGVLNVKCSTSCVPNPLKFWSFGRWSVPSIQSTDPLATAFASCRGLVMATCGLAGTVAAEFESARTKLSHLANVSVCGAGGDGGTTGLTLSVQVTVPGLSKFGFHWATL